MSLGVPRLRDLSIKNKLILLQFFTCLIVLALCCAAFVIADVKEYKETKVKNLTSVAQLIGSSSISALEFMDNAAAQATLSDLIVEKDIVNAQILDKSGNVFASYSKEGQGHFTFSDKRTSDVEFKNDFLIVYHEIVKETGEVVGRVCLRAELQQLNDAINRKMQIALFLLVVGMVLAYFIAVILQKYISAPLLRLVSVMQKVSREGNYETFAKVEGKDETGVLSSVFNDMLKQIKKRDNKLSENNSLLNSILNSMGDAVIVVDKRVNLILWNPAYESLNDRIALRDTKNLFYPDTELAMKFEETALFKAVHGESSYNQENLIKDEGKDNIFVSITARPLKDQDGEIIGAVAIVRDITHRKRIQKALDTARQQLQDMMDYSSAIIFAKDIKGKYIFVNKHFETIYDTDRDDVIGKSDYDFQPAEEVEQLIAHDTEVLNVGQSISFEEQIFRNGRLRTFICVKFPLKDMLGKIYGICGIATDITDRKEVEEADRMRVLQMIKFQETLLNLTSLEIDLPLEEKLKSILSTCSEVIDVERSGIWFLNEERSEILPEIIYEKSKGSYVQGNPISKDTCPRYFKELDKFHTIDSYDALNDPRTSELASSYLEPLGIKSMMDVAIRVGGKITGILCFEQVGKKKKWSYEIQVFSSSIAGIVSLAIENSERIKAESELHAVNYELAKAKNAAEQSSAAKDAFLASMSHEIRTPLNAIIGFQQLLKESGLNDEQKEIVESIDFAGRNLLVIINDVLDLSKIEAGKVEFVETEMNVAHIIKSVIELFEQKASEKKLKLIFNHDPSISSHLLGDGARLSQILLNLIGNAIKFTEKGQIIVSTQLLEETDKALTCRFKVKDTGIGIEREKLEGIFERFTQANADTTRKYGGTGLGLTISRHLVELQGGMLNVESEPGKGSTFSFILRYKKGRLIKGTEGKLPAVEYQADDFISRSLNILLAEDTLLNQNLIIKLFKKTNHKIDIANNGFEALSMVEKNDYDIILMDVQMPEMDGIQATKAIRQLRDPIKRGIPIIALTAFVSNTEEDKYRKIGMDAYITKPFKKEFLFEVIYNLTAMSNKEPENSKSKSKADSGFSLSFLEEASDGDKNFVIGMVKMILDEVPGRLSMLKDAIKERDYNSIKSTAHKIKNLVIPLQMERAQNLATEIEENSRNAGNIQIIVAQCSELSEILENVMDPLKKEVKVLQDNV